MQCRRHSFVVLATLMQRVGQLDGLMRLGSEYLQGSAGQRFSPSWVASDFHRRIELRFEKKWN